MSTTRGQYEFIKMYQVIFYRYLRKSSDEKTFYFRFPVLFRFFRCYLIKFVVWSLQSKVLHEVLFQMTKIVEFIGRNWSLDSR